MPEQQTRSPYGRSPYDGQAAYWNSAAARPWSLQYERMDRALSGLTDALLAAAALVPGERVLDIGCGSGTTVLELAKRVGPGGHVLGADIAEDSAARAVERVAAAGLRHVEVICADAATHRFAAASVDLAFSRLGVMFFADPTAAFTNVRLAMRVGGRTALGVFRSPDENPWPNGPLQAVRHLLPAFDPPRADAPNMFSLAEPARVRRILEGAGFRDISLSPVDTVLRLAGAEGGVTEAADFAVTFGPLTRVLPSLPQDQQQGVRTALETFFQSHATPEGVMLASHFWIVQARA
jgi:ubiquinone/menaquinone biosynthesis C-methylase UbiE